MSLSESFFRWAGRLYFEKPAHKQTLAEHLAALRRSGADLHDRLSAFQGERNPEQLRHVIGIERWGQSRLRVLIGKPFVPGGHRPYLPREDLSWDELVRDFAATRAETAEIVERIAAENPNGVVAHNQFGELSARGWLRYLTGHAERELRKFR